MLLLGLGLLAAGILLVVVEVFIPSGGLIAVAAAGCAIAGVYCLFRVGTTWGLAGIGAVLVLGPASFGFALRIWPHTPIGRKMLMGEVTEEQLEAQRAEEERQREQFRAMVGAEGVALTPLRPIGAVRIGSEKFEALAETTIIEAGQKVRVVAAQDNQLKVRAIS